MNKEDFSDIKVIKPEKKILTKFNFIISPFMENILEKEKENLQLIRKKMYLLPMLMNGQVHLNRAIS